MSGILHLPKEELGKVKQKYGPICKEIPSSSLGKCKIPDIYGNTGCGDFKQGGGGAHLCFWAFAFHFQILGQILALFDTSPINPILKSQ